MDAAAILANSANAGILDYRWRRRDGLGLHRFKLVEVNNWDDGGHPDVVERLAVLAGEIGRDSIHSLGGSVIIAHRSTGTILGTIIGTAYMLRMAPPLHDELDQADLSSTKTWSDGRTTDLFTEVDQTGSGEVGISTKPDGWPKRSPTTTSMGRSEYRCKPSVGYPLIPPQHGAMTSR